LDIERAIQPRSTRSQHGGRAHASDRGRDQKHLGLEPHPTCGFTTVSYLSPHRVANEALPAGYQGTHTLASALYLLVTPKRQMKLHRLRSDQIYHHYLGDPLEVLPAPAGRQRHLGHGRQRSRGRHAPSAADPGGRLARFPPQGRRQLRVARHDRIPGLRPSDLEIGDVAALMRAYPDFRAEIPAFTATADTGSQSSPG
jgi:uncharacterized protein